MKTAARRFTGEVGMVSVVTDPFRLDHEAWTKMLKRLFKNSTNGPKCDANFLKLMPENVTVLSWKYEDMYLFSGPEFEFGAFFCRSLIGLKLNATNK